MVEKGKGEKRRGHSERGRRRVGGAKEFLEISQWRKKR